MLWARRWRGLKNGRQNMNEPKLAAHIAALALGLAGAWVVVANAGWLVLLGLLLIMWGENINRKVRDSE